MRPLPTASLPANSTEYAGAETWESYLGTVDAGTSKEKMEQFVQAPQALVRRFTPIPSPLQFHWPLFPDRRIHRFIGF